MDDRAVLVHKVNTIRLTMRIVLQKVIARRVEEALKGVELELQQGPFVHIARAVDQHMATGLGQVGGLVILQLVRLDDHAAPAQHGIAFKQRFKIRATRHAVTLNKGGHGVACRCGRLLLQLRAALQQQGLLLRADAGALQQSPDHPGHRALNKALTQVSKGPNQGRPAFRVVHQKAHRAEAVSGGGTKNDRLGRRAAL